MMVLITGGCGFLGTHLARYLIEERGQEVRLFDLSEPAPEIRDSVEWVEGSVLDPEAVALACQGIDVVYHTAALVPLSKAGHGFDDVNTLGTRTVVDACIEAGVTRLVHVSSSAVYEPGVTEMPVTEESPLLPVGRYGRSKLAAEHEVMAASERGLEWTIIRPRTIVDEGRGGIFQILFDWAMAGRTLYTIGDGSNTFQLVSARDVARACVLAAECPQAADEDFDIGAAEYGTLHEVMRDLADHAGTGSRVRHLNAPLARLALLVLDKTGLSPLAEWHYRTMDKPFYFSNEKPSMILGWSPNDSNRTLMERSYDWYVEHHGEIDARRGTGHRFAPGQGILRILRRMS